MRTESSARTHGCRKFALRNKQGQRRWNKQGQSSKQRKRPGGSSFAGMVSKSSERGQQSHSPRSCRPLHKLTAQPTLLRAGSIETVSEVLLGRTKPSSSTWRTGRGSCRQGSLVILFAEPGCVRVVLPRRTAQAVGLNRGRWPRSSFARVPAQDPASRA